MTTVTKALATLAVFALPGLAGGGTGAEPLPASGFSQRVAVFMGYYRPT